MGPSGPPPPPSSSTESEVTVLRPDTQAMPSTGDATIRVGLNTVDGRQWRTTVGETWKLSKVLLKAKETTAQDDLEFLYLETPNYRSQRDRWARLDLGDFVMDVLREGDQLLAMPRMRGGAG